jgi:hypothetical protein
MCNGIHRGGTCVRTGTVLLKQDVFDFCLLPRDAFLRLLRVSLERSEFTVAPFFRESASTTPAGFQNTVNMAFSAEA